MADRLNGFWNYARHWFNKLFTLLRNKNSSILQNTNRSFPKISKITLKLIEVISPVDSMKRYIVNTNSNSVDLFAKCNYRTASPPLNQKKSKISYHYMVNFEITQLG
jgi:hypothetical protein